MDLAQLQPGDVFVTPTYGNLFDRFVGGAIRYMTATQDSHGKWLNSPVNHTGIYVGDGKIIEAKPGGATLSDWNSYGDAAFWSTRGLYLYGQGGELVPQPQLSPPQRERLVNEAVKLVGTPYGFLDIAAIGFAQKRLHGLVDVRKALASQPWWVRRIESRRTLICSQLVDTAFCRAGVHLFQDNRLPGLVSPGDIYRLFQS